MIYKYDGSEYQPIQTMNVGIAIIAMAINHERFIVSGAGSSINVYQQDGIGFAFHQTLVTGEAYIYDFFALKDLSRLLIGGAS